MRSILWSGEELARITGGELTKDFNAKGISKDSRNCSREDLYIAIAGPKFDGHDFLPDALANGASGALVAQDWYKKAADNGTLKPQFPLVVVQDVAQAINAIAKAARQRSKAKLIAITGSYGKTTMKNLVAHILKSYGRVYATQSSFNGKLGVPYTMAALPMDVDFAVIEMGIDEPGILRGYSKLCSPDIAMVTITGNAHLGKFGSLENVAQAKSEIFEFLKPNGTAIINQRDAFYDLLADKTKGFQRITFSGLDGDKEKEENHAQVQCVHASHGIDGSTVELALAGDVLADKFFIPGLSKHWSSTLAGAMAVIHCLGLDVSKLSKALAGFELTQGRGNLVKSGNITIIDESYNAGPDSMAMALNSAAQLKTKLTKGRIIALLGDMLDLGEKSAAMHSNLFDQVDFSKFDKVYCIGDQMQELYKRLPDASKGGGFKDVNAALDLVKANARSGDIYLIKGSRNQYASRGHMAALVDALQDDALDAAS